MTVRLCGSKLNIFDTRQGLQETGFLCHVGLIPLHPPAQTLDSDSGLHRIQKETYISDLDLAFGNL